MGRLIRDIIVWVVVCGVIGGSAGVSSAAFGYPLPAAAVTAALFAGITGCVVAAFGIAAAQPWRQGRTIQVGRTTVRVSVVSAETGVDPDRLASELALYLFHTVAAGKTPDWPVPGNSERRTTGGPSPARPAEAAPTPLLEGRPVPSGWTPRGPSGPDDAFEPASDAYDWAPGLCEATGREDAETRECLYYGPDGMTRRVATVSRAVLAADDDLRAEVSAAERELLEDLQLKGRLASQRPVPV